MTTRICRRDALKTTLALGTGVLVASRRAFGGESPNEKLNVAFIGVGGQGAANVKRLASQNMVAFADVDDQRAAKTYEQFPDVKRYRDYRKMLDELHTKLDAVAVSTPDHMHFHPAYAVLQYNLHLYLEKPLAHNLWQTRTLIDLAKQKKRATQLGVQRHAMANMHRIVELIQSGAIGEVREVYSWMGGSRGMPDVPTDQPPVPETLDWDLWIGAGKFRPYHPSICPYGWRFWWDYGTGETGNFGCHILDIPFWALGLKYPSKVDGSGPPVDPQRTPKSMQTRFEFPADGRRPAVTLHWDHAADGPEILRKHGMPSKGNNNLFIGSKGMLLCGFGSRQLWPKEQFEKYEAPEPFVPDSPGFHEEFITACRGGAPATCSFDYSGPLAETVLLGNLAYRAGGFEWDAAQLKPKGNPAAEALIREPMRRGWEIG